MPGRERYQTVILAIGMVLLSGLAGVLIAFSTGGALTGAPAPWTPPPVSPTVKRATITPRATAVPAQAGAAGVTPVATTPKAPATLKVEASPTSSTPPTAAITASATAPRPTAAATATAWPTPRPTPSPTAAPPSAVVMADTLYLRTGPGAQYSSIGLAYAGETYTITARSADNVPGGPPSGWWQVCCAKGQSVWLSAEWVKVSAATEGVPVSR